MNVLLRLENTREEIYVGVSRKICDFLFAKECRSVQNFTKDVKPFVEAYVLTMTSNCTTFESDRANTKYSNHYELYKSFKYKLGEQRFYFLRGKFFVIKDNLIADCAFTDSRGWKECQLKYESILAKRKNFNSRLRMFFTRNYIETRKSYLLYD